MNQFMIKANGYSKEVVFLELLLVVFMKLIIISLKPIFFGVKKPVYYAFTDYYLLQCEVA